MKSDPVPQGTGATGLPERLIVNVERDIWHDMGPGGHVASAVTPELAAAIVERYNAHAELLEALQAIVACDVPLRYGLLEQARAALNRATRQPGKTEDL